MHVTEMYKINELLIEVVNDNNATQRERELVKHIDVLMTELDFTTDALHRLRDEMMLDGDDDADA